MAFTLLQMLDKVLEWFAMEPDQLFENETNEKVLEPQVYAGIKIHFPDIDNDKYYIGNLRLILDKLQKENYISRIPIPNVYDEYFYSVTFDGKFFSQTGGYEARENQRLAQNTRIQSLESSQREHNAEQAQLAKNLNCLTFWIAIGTIAAALYYLTELYWNHGWFRFCH